MKMITKVVRSVSPGFVALACTAAAHSATVAVWSFNGNTTESVAGRNGVLVDGAGYGTGVSGPSLLLDGANDHVSVPDSPAWTFGAADFSISMWVNFATVRTGDLGSAPNVFIGHDEGGGNRNKWAFLYTGSSGGQLAFHINDPSLGPVNLIPSVAFAATTDQWYHLAVTRSGSEFTFYADGNSLGSVTNSRVIPDADSPLTIGEVEGLGFFHGRLDEVAFFNTALSHAEVQNLASIPEPSTHATWLLLGGLAVAGHRRRAVGR